MAGASAGGDDIDYKTGEYNYTADAYVAAIELLLALKADGRPHGPRGPRYPATTGRSPTWDPTKKYTADDDKALNR